MDYEVEEYKGHKILVLKDTEAGKEDKFPFKIGLRKARIILARLEEIRKFVEAGGK